MSDNWFKFLYDLALTLKDTFSGLLKFLSTEVEIGVNTYSLYECLFGVAIFGIIIYGIIAFIIDVLP